MRSLAKNALEPITVFTALLDLARVRWTDGCDQVSVRNADLHEIEGSVKLKWTRWVELSVVEAGARHHFARKQTLIPEVVNRKHKAGRLEDVAATIKLSQIRGD